MSWKEISFDVPDDLKDAILGELSEHGMSGAWESDPKPGETHIVAYFEQGSDLPAIRASVLSLLARANVPAPPITLGTLEDHDWTEKWKKSYRSFPIGKGFFVIPSWSQSSCPDDRMPIYIDPGQAFGT